MNIIQIFQRFPTHESCLKHLEKTRWGSEPSCPYCGGLNVAKKHENSRIGRWNCHACKSSFNVLQGTIFQKSKIPLQKWFLAVGLVLNAKKGVSSYQLARDLDMNQKTAWFMAHRIRRAMLKSREEAALLQGIIEADETYVGGKPRKSNRRDDDKNGGSGKSGRGTDKLPVVGMVERDGNVIAEPVDKKDLTGEGLYGFISSNVSAGGALLITDESPAYRLTGRRMPHETVNHAVEYVRDGLIHTNTIEGFWSLVKRAWYGQHHHYSAKYAHLYIAESCFKYNNRKILSENAFTNFMKMVMV